MSHDMYEFIGCIHEFIAVAVEASLQVLVNAETNAYSLFKQFVAKRGFRCPHS